MIQAADGNLYGTASGGGANRGALFRLTTAGTFTNLYSFAGTGDGSYPQAAPVQGGDGNLYGTTSNWRGESRRHRLHVRARFPSGVFRGRSGAIPGRVLPGVSANGNIFGYYEYLSTPGFVYHFDLGFEYVFDAADGHGGVYLYDFKSGDYFYTSPTFPFPYLYDFTLKAFLYYYPDPTNPQRYNTNGVRYFFNFSTSQIIS